MLEVRGRVFDAIPNDLALCEVFYLSADLAQVLVQVRTHPREHGACIGAFKQHLQLFRLLMGPVIIQSSSGNLKSVTELLNCITSLASFATDVAVWVLPSDDRIEIS